MAEVVGQVVVAGRLLWCRSTDSSSGRVEEDGAGFPPDEIRAQLLREEGLWNVNVEAADDKARLVMALRRLLDLSLDHAAAALRAIPGTVYTGTRVEAEWLQTHLQAEGARVVVAQAA